MCQAVSWTMSPGNMNAAKDPIIHVDAPELGSIEALGGRGALYLLALAQSHNHGRRLAPTRDATASVLLVLSALGVVHTDTTATSNVTYGGDGLHWSYSWAAEPYAGLEERLSDYLATHGRHARFAETWLRIWRELFPPEVTSYLRYHLRAHGFDTRHEKLLEPIMAAHAGSFAIGHWRYACWASVRSMASKALQHPGDEDLLNKTLILELPRRLRLAFNAPGDNLCFSPSYSMSPYTLSTALATVATDLGDEVWKSVPNIERLR